VTVLRRRRRSSVDDADMARVSFHWNGYPSRAVGILVRGFVRGLRYLCGGKGISDLMLFSTVRDGEC
jgi:hypothetical protein